MVRFSLFDRSEIHSVTGMNKMHHHALVLAVHAWLYLYLILTSNFFSND